MRLKIIFLNGPPGCGKDVAADALSRDGWHAIKFAAPLKRALSTLLGLPEQDMENKDSIMPDGRTTIRDLLIKISEEVIKPALGRDHFGKLAAKAILRTNKLYRFEKFVFSDSGFEDEVQGCLNYLNDHGMEFTYDIWKIVRPGCDFSGDSRSYLNEGLTIDNDGTLAEFRAKVSQEAEGW
jgi:hypothetical protein